MDFLVAGLGNPGSEYEGTRHNVGFAILDELSRQCDCGPWREKWQGLGSSAYQLEKKVFFLKPQTFMNRSGQSVARYHEFFKLDCKQLFVIHDDLDMPFARIKLVKGGGSGGHNGIRSLVSCLGEQNFYRLKIGIGRPGKGDVHPNFPVEKYVLSHFSSDEEALLQLRMEHLVQGFLEFIRGDVPRAMGIFNSLK